MTARLLADLTVLLHLAFILFAVLGGLLALRWPRAAWVHLPTAAWAAAIELGGWICPLTPLENALRIRAGEAGYAGGFVEHYLLPLVYPAGLTREIQFALAGIMLLVNIAIYLAVARRWRILESTPRREGARTRSKGKD
jgi:hypothetical protein